MPRENLQHELAPEQAERKQKQIGFAYVRNFSYFSEVQRMNQENNISI